MTKAQKRFSWWLVAYSLLLAICGLLFSLIETVGRQGTIVGRFHRIVCRDLEGPSIPPGMLANNIPLSVKAEGMTIDEAFRILGTPDYCHDDPVGWAHWADHLPPQDIVWACPYCCDTWNLDRMKVARWTEGPVEVTLGFGVDERPGRQVCIVFAKKLHVTNTCFSAWHVRRWAEQAWTAIHGPRR